MIARVRIAAVPHRTCALVEYVEIRSGVCCAVPPPSKDHDAQGRNEAASDDVGSTERRRRSIHTHASIVSQDLLEVESQSLRRASSRTPILQPTRIELRSRFANGQRFCDAAHVARVVDLMRASRMTVSDQRQRIRILSGHDP